MAYIALPLHAAGTCARARMRAPTFLQAQSACAWNESSRSQLCTNLVWKGDVKATTMQDLGLQLCTGFGFGANTVCWWAVPKKALATQTMTAYAVMI